MPGTRQPRRKLPTAAEASIAQPWPTDLADFKAFKSHRLVRPFRDRYETDALLATYALARVIQDLQDLESRYREQHDTTLFTAVQGRVKEENSFVKKLQESCQELATTKGFARETIEEAYAGIKDLCGVRVSCPYIDQIVPTINGVIRPRLGDAGYATDLRQEPGHADKDLLEFGDERGYRSYHLYLSAPTVVDIYGKIEMCLCEVQVRTELQHVWADKSHNLVYKPDEGWDHSDSHVLADMREASNLLKAVDQHLVSIRDRARKAGES